MRLSTSLLQLDDCVADLKLHSLYRSQHFYAKLCVLLANNSSWHLLCRTVYVVAWHSLYYLSYTVVKTVMPAWQSSTLFASHSRSTLALIFITLHYLSNVDIVYQPLYYRLAIPQLVCIIPNTDLATPYLIHLELYRLPLIIDTTLWI